MPHFSSSDLIFRSIDWAFSSYIQTHLSYLWLLVTVIFHARVQNWSILCMKTIALSNNESWIHNYVIKSITVCIDFAKFDTMKW